MNDNFEHHLHRQPLKQIPAEWRAEILAAARPSPRAARRWFLPSSIFHPPSYVFRWSALAAAWVVIFALNYAARDASPVVLAKATPPSPQMILALREQRKLLSELTETPNSTTPTDRPKPQPHSQRQEARMSC